MGEPGFRSWGATAGGAAAAAARRRERLRQWVRPQSVLVAVVVVILDVAVVVTASAITGIYRARNDQACSTLWRDLARDQTVGLWIVVVLVVVTVLAVVRWRWVLVATLVVQTVVALVLIPGIVDRRAAYTAVAEGRRSAVEVDTGGAACTASPTRVP